MQLNICFQDPTHAETTYLYEAILEAATNAILWRGMYAFASRDGVDYLIEDEVIQEFMRKGGEINLLVGLDAVTNQSTLERLQELERKNERFQSRVFWNETAGLFHPKLSDFSDASGSRTLIIGSGNLTPGGLMANYESYAVITTESDEEMDVSAIDEFMERHVNEIRSIDNEAFERAAQNLVRPIKGSRQASKKSIIKLRRPKILRPKSRTVSTKKIARVLLAEVPKAGDRWAQVHFNVDVVREYFRISDYQTQRVYLTQVTSNGMKKDIEVRQCIYSQINRNHKIEIGAAKGIEYPETPPLLVFQERQLRVFDYMLLMPGDDGYGSLIDLTHNLPPIGRGFPRVITNVNELEKAWANCPLLALEDTKEQEI